MKDAGTISFRPTKDEESAFQQALEALGVNRSELIHEIFLQGFDSAIAVLQEKQKEKMAYQMKMLRGARTIKMVRDTGFEPVTPTVSRDRLSPEKWMTSPLYSPSQQHLLPDGIKPVVGVLHGIELGDSHTAKSSLPPLSSPSGETERTL